MQQLNPIYFILVFLLYFLFTVLPSKFRPFTLLLGSLGYYVYIESKFFYVFFAIIIITYFAGKIIEQARLENKKKYLILYLIIILGIYIPFKYNLSFNFITSYLFKKEYSRLLLPLGISFFTFHTASYVFDVYYGKIKAEKSFYKCALYISFFPQIICGPIERYEKIIAQIEKTKTEDNGNTVQAIFLICLGVFKKYILANNMVSFGLAYAAGTQLSGVEWIIISIITRYHLFLDLSGYTDIALGIGKLFGINFTNNFNRPFSASTIDEFWRRWHITLSTWVRDYVFYPSISFVKSSAGIYVCLIGSFVFLGIWHGDSMNYLIYGFLNGLAIVITLITRKLLAKHQKLNFLKAFSWPFTFVFFISLPAILLKAETLKTALKAYKEVFLFGEAFWSVSGLTEFIVEDIGNLLPLIALFEVMSYYNKEGKLLKWLESKKTTYHFVMIFFFLVIFFVYVKPETFQMPYIYEKH